VLAFDSENDCFLPFGKNRTVGDEEKVAFESQRGAVGWDRGLTRWLSYVVFDIVYAEGPGVEEVIARALGKGKGTASNTTSATSSALTGERLIFTACPFYPFCKNVQQQRVQ
jgi:hypothetical protein